MKDISKKFADNAASKKLELRIIELEKKLSKTDKKQTTTKSQQLLLLKFLELLDPILKWISVIKRNRYYYLYY